MNRKPPCSSVQHTGGFRAAAATTTSHRWLKLHLPSCSSFSTCTAHPSASTPKTPRSCLSFHYTSFDTIDNPPRSSVQHTGGFQASPATTRSHRWLKFQSFFMLLFFDIYCTSFGFNTKDSTLLSQLPFRIFHHEQKTTAFQYTAHGRDLGSFCKYQIPPMAEIPIFLHRVPVYSTPAGSRLPLQRPDPTDG